MNSYEQIDFDAMQEAEAILSGAIPSTSETFQMVKDWYGDIDRNIVSRNNAIETLRFANDKEVQMIIAAFGNPPGSKVVKIGNRRTNVIRDENGNLEQGKVAA